MCIRDRFYTNYQGSSAGSLTLLDAQGVEQSFGINEEVLDVSAAGDYVAVLTSNELNIYKNDLSVYASTSNSWGARRVLMREDGSALLVLSLIHISVLFPRRKHPENGCFRRGYFFALLL